MYFIIKNVTKKEIHIFKGKEELKGKITINQHSICKNWSKNDSITTISAGFNVNEQKNQKSCS